MNKAKTLTAALVLVLAGLAVCAWMMFGSSAGLTFANADKYTAGSTQVTEPVESLVVDWTNGKVHIEYHPGSGVTVSETANRELTDDIRLRWWLDGTTLRIHYIKSGMNLNFNLQKELTVSLPKGTVLKTADIGTTSGDIIAAGLAADEIVLGSTSGDITASVVTKKLKATATSGGLKISQDSALETAVFGTTSGSIGVTLSDVNEVSADSTSGSIGLTLSGSAGSVRLGSTSGNVYPDLASVVRADFSSTSGSISGRVLSFRDLKAGSTSGSVTLKLPAEPGFTCRAETTSGSFSSEIALEKNGNTYSCGDGSAKCAIGTTSGNITLQKAE